MARGRKVNQAAKVEAEEALLNAATELLKSKSYKEISLRELAQLANQNVAMISYYFGSKEKLFVELITRKINAAQSPSAPSHNDSKQCLSASVRIKMLLKQLIGMHIDNPWLAGFLLHNVLASESKIRKLFIDKVVKNNAEVLSSAIKEMNDSSDDTEGILAINEEYLRVSIVSLVAFPFVASPLLNEAFDFDIRNIDADEWVEHNYQLLIARFASKVTNSESVT
jgi:AcrR family transcriptional regulator